MNRPIPRRRLTVAVILGVLALPLIALLVAELAFRGLTTHTGFDTDSAREHLADDGATTERSEADLADAASPAPHQDGATPSASHQGDDLEVTLLLGSDAREGLGGARADVIMLGLLPTDGREPALVSLPRDLWVTNPCTGGPTRVNAGFAGCGDDVSGPELMAVMVEDFTGLTVDHSVTLDFEGFREIVDLLGGVEICVDHPVRDYRTGAGLDLPAGCTVAGGEDALAWVTSRTTQEYVDGAWRTVDGVNDLTRNQRQRDLIRTITNQVADRASPREILAVAREASRWATFDDDFDLPDAIRVAWSLRGGGETIRDGELAVRGMVTDAGAQVLLADEAFDQVLARVWPEATADDGAGAAR